MMAIKRADFTKLLKELANALDVPEKRHEEAITRYEKVGEWLGSEGSPLTAYDPGIYPQGSFRLGTAIKPLNDVEEYDIDLVCEMKLLKEQVSQQQLKEMIGNRLKAHGTYKKLLGEEGRRCWTLNYADDAQFHMDILPAIPDDEGYKRLLIENFVSPDLGGMAICITDNTRENFTRIDLDWPRSNPKGYAEWFKGRMRIRFDERSKALAEEMRTEVEDVPEYKVKTPLQRAIQILKRHRDIMFQYNKDDKPISIIITTLAAHAYNNEDDLLDAVINIVKGMADHIDIKNGVSWVPNPVNPFENFADKWQEHPQRETWFKAWLEQVQADFADAQDKSDFVTINESLAPRFGAGTLKKALIAIGLPTSTTNTNILKPTVPHVEINEPNKPWGICD